MAVPADLQPLDRGDGGSVRVLGESVTGSDGAADAFFVPLGHVVACRGG